MAACSTPDNEDPDDGDVIPPENPDTPDDEDKPEYDKNGIIVPEYKDYGRGTRDFELYALDYSRPDIDAYCAEFEEACALINENTVPFEEQLAVINSLELKYNTFYSMYSLSEIYSYKDTSNDYWAGEYEYLSTNSARFSRSIEQLFVACAQSVHKDRFEEEYFTSDISEYSDGGRYSDEVVALMTEEARLESCYRNPDFTDLTLSFLGVTDTYQNHVDRISSYPNYAFYLANLNDLASRAYMTDIYIDIVKVRYELADAFGYDSYTELAYGTLGYDYTSKDLRSFIEDISEYVVPVYNELSLSYFNPYFQTAQSQKRQHNTIINTLHGLSGTIDGEFGEIFSYMLQHKLYDIQSAGETRFDNAFTTYLYTNTSPFIFVTTAGTLDDFATIAHEFGHFIDYYVNNSSASSLEIAETCSQSYELLSLIYAKDVSNKTVFKYLKYTAMRNALEVLIFQSMYAAIEHAVYELGKDNVNEASLNQLVNETVGEMLGTTATYSISSVLIPHMFIAPMYVQSYATSIVPSLEIFLSEYKEKGAGVGAYKKIIYRDGEESFLLTLGEAGLSSPFKDGLLDDISNELFFYMTGRYYKTELDEGINVA